MNRRRFLIGTTAAATTSVASRFALPLVAQPRRPMRDAIVLIPGIMGTVLQRNGRDVWALSGAALLSGLTSRGHSIGDLALTRDSQDAQDIGDGVVASRLLADTHLIPGLWKIDGYSRVAAAIRDHFDVQTDRNYFEFGYDWRRDNRAAAHRLRQSASRWLAEWRRRGGDPGARLIVVAHSMGGLVASYFLEVLGGWQDTRMLVTFGTPYRGSLNALNALANGIRKTFAGVSVADVSSLVRSFTSVYQLLPTYPCYDPGDGRLHRLSDASGIPNLDQRRCREALQFHDEIRRARDVNASNPAYAKDRYTIHPIVGTFQTTLQVGRIAAAGVEMSSRHPGADVQGDGTVPQTSALPVEPRELEKLQRPVYVSEIHGSMQNSETVLQHVRGLLAEGSISQDLFRADRGDAIALKVEDLYRPGESVVATVRCETTGSLSITITDAGSGRQLSRRFVTQVGNDAHSVDCGVLSEGTFRITAADSSGRSVSDVFVVLPS